MNAGDAATQNTGENDSIEYFFPVYIPSGVGVVARCQADQLSETVNMRLFLLRHDQYPYTVGYVDALGANTGTSQGVSVTAGNKVWGTWTQIIASTTRDYECWTVGAGGNADNNKGNRLMVVEIGVGPDSGNVTPIAGHYYFRCKAAEQVLSYGKASRVQRNPVPSGNAIWARAASSGSVLWSPDIIVYGML
jgi:hypothetical protein